MAILRTILAALLLGALLATGSPAAAQDADTPLDRALQEVEALLSDLKSRPDADEKLVARLEAVASNLRKARDAAGGREPGNGPQPPAPGGGGGPPPGADWALARARESFLRGVELKEAEKAVADDILVEFAADYNLAKSHEDEKSRPVIRDHTARRINRSFAPREANRLEVNLDGIIKFWEGRWGRGGR